MRPIVCKFCGHEGELVEVVVDGITNYQGECKNPKCVLYPFNTEPMPIKARARGKNLWGEAIKKKGSCAMLKTLITKIKSLFQKKPSTFKPWQVGLMLKSQPKKMSIKELLKAYKEGRVCL
jgi:hypothetical protein